MKRALSVCFVLLLLLTVPVSAASGKLTAQPVRGSVGEKVTISVHLDNPGLVAMRMLVRYDPQVLRLESAANGEVFEKGALFGNDLSADPYAMIWEDSLRTDNITKSGTLCTLCFTVLKGTASGETNVRFTVDKGSTFDVNLKEAAVEDGTCIVQMPSDASGQTTAAEKTVGTTTKPASGKTTTASASGTAAERTTAPAAKAGTTAQTTVAAKPPVTTTKANTQMQTTSPAKPETATVKADTVQTTAGKEDAAVRTSTAVHDPKQQETLSVQTEETAAIPADVAAQTTDAVPEDTEVSASAAITQTSEDGRIAQETSSYGARDLLWLLLIPAAAVVIVIVYKKKKAESAE